MSTFRRMASGALASWLRIGLNLLAQLLLVPVYLKHWTPDIYGSWIALIALQGVVNIFSVGFQNYVGAEFMQLAHGERAKMWELWRRSIPTALYISLFEIVLIVGIIVSGLYLKLIPVNSAEQQRELILALVAYSLVWSISGSVGGVAVRILGALGCFHKIAWWSVVSGVVIALAPCLAVTAGGGVFLAGVSLAAGILIYNIPFHLAMWRMLKEEGMPVFQFGGHAWREAGLSLAIVLKYSLEMLRQQGVRLLLAPLMGGAQLAAFATMRTGANVALQGVGSITQPLTPELMRFLHHRDQERSEAAFASVWFVVIFILAPGMIVFQWFVPTLYDAWTLGKLEFDPLLFALISSTILIFSAAQPAMAIAQAHNHLKIQLCVSGSAICLLLMLLYVSYPWFGIAAVGWALLLAEIVSLVGFHLNARRWMSENGLAWPARAYCLVLLASGLSGMAMICIAILPNHAPLIMTLSLVALGNLGYRYWVSLPPLAKAKLASLTIHRFAKGRSA